VMRRNDAWREKCWLMPNPITITAEQINYSHSFVPFCLYYFRKSSHGKTINLPPRQLLSSKCSKEVLSSARLDWWNVARTG